MSEVTDDSLLISGSPKVARPRGRPRVEEQRSTVSTWLPASQHDRLIRLANQQEKSVSALVRSLLLLRIR